MLMPKRVKFRRMQRGRMTGKATRGNTVSNGEFGLMALEPGWVKSNQIEAAGKNREKKLVKAYEKFNSAVICLRNISHEDPTSPVHTFEP